MARQHLGRFRTLQREQRALVEMVEGDLVGQVFAQMADVVPFGRAVDHQIERVGPARDHQVVEHTAVLVEQQRIALLAELEGRQVNRQHRFDRSIEIGAGQEQLPHVRHVEQPGIRPGPFVFGNDAPVRPGILDRHVIAGKGYHPGTARAVPAVQRQRAQHLGLGLFAVVVHAYPRLPAPASRNATPPPLSGNLRASCRSRARHFFLRWPLPAAGTLSRVSAGPAVPFA